MDTQKTPVYRDPSRDSYWARIILAKDKNKHTKLFMCASYEYLVDSFKTRDFGEKELNKWRDGVVERWQSKNSTVFKKAVHFHVDAVTLEGQKKGMQFLRDHVARV